MKQPTQAELEAIGWTPEGARDILAHATHPMIQRFFHRLAGTRPPRIRTPTPKQAISNRIRKAVFERDAYRCQHCGAWRDLSVDHIIPESAGGTLDLENLQTLCQPCNSRKGARLPQE